MKYLMFFVPLVSFAANAPLKVEFKNAQGASAGHAEVSEAGKGVKVKLSLKGLPAGLHAFHVHENGKCDGPKFESAGAHFNPTKAAHGFRADKGPHSGDFENIMVKADGSAEIELKNDRLSLSGGQNSLRKAGGTALVVHAAPDDGKSQPSGNSGDRIACAVIQ